MSFARRLNITESSDGDPLATQISELFFRFPYDRLPPRPSLVAPFLRPEVAYGLIVLYLLSETPVARFRDAIRLDPDGAAFRSAVAVHNIVLFVFSAAVALNAWPIVVRHYLDRGLYAAYCDRDGTLWRDANLGTWATVFYLSKYYEFLDTWILVLKGKRASFLQVYHHAGVVFTMYGGVCSQSAWLGVVVLLNSVIHTLMYAYFFVKTVWPRLDIKAARYLTAAQIGQFFLGIATTAGVLFMGNDCDTQSSRFSLACLHLYGIGLIALFLNFANRKYKKS